MHPSGTFCWAQLHSARPELAAEFYARLMGWTSQPIAHSPGHRLFLSQGRAAAALSPLADPKVPPHWLPYVAVEDVDATCSLIKKARGRVVMAPFEAQQAGRMAVACDPTGAYFCLWQARDHAGAAVVSEVGGMAWHELITSHPQKASRFYCRVFGWQPRQFSLGNIPYTMHTLAERQVAGMMPKPKGVAMPSLWIVYFQVADYATAIQQCSQGGGQATMQAIEIEGVGCFCTLLDAEGAPFAVLSR